MLLLYMFNIVKLKYCSNITVHLNNGQIWIDHLICPKRLRRLTTQMTSYYLLLQNQVRRFVCIIRWIVFYDIPYSYELVVEDLRITFILTATISSDMNLCLWLIFSLVAGLLELVWMLQTQYNTIESIKVPNSLSSAARHRCRLLLTIGVVRTRWKRLQRQESSCFP